MNITCYWYKSSRHARNKQWIACCIFYVVIDSWFILLFRQKSEMGNENNKILQQNMIQAPTYFKNADVSRKNTKWNHDLLLSSVLVFHSMVEHQVILLDREMEGYKKSITEEQEQNETLTMQLNWSQMDVATSKKLISQKQTHQEALQAHYSTCLRTLRETERTLARLTKVDGGQGKLLSGQSEPIFLPFLPSVTTPKSFPFLHHSRKPVPTRLKRTIKGGR